MVYKRALGFTKSLELLKQGGWRELSYPGLAASRRSGHEGDNRVGHVVDEFTPGPGKVGRDLTVVVDVEDEFPPSFQGSRLPRGAGFVGGFLEAPQFETPSSNVFGSGEGKDLFLLPRGQDGLEDRGAREVPGRRLDVESDSTVSRDDAADPAVAMREAEGA